MSSCPHDWKVREATEGLKYRCQVCDAYGYKRRSANWYGQENLTKAVIPYRCRIKGCKEPGVIKSWSSFKEAFLCELHK